MSLHHSIAHEEMNHMKIFGKERESLRIKKARAVRAIYVSEEVQEVEIHLLTEDKEKLTLRMPSRAARTLILDLTNAYDAINPPLRSTGAAQWDGMTE